MELQCIVQTYEWGKLGYDSKVAVLHKLSNPSFKVEDNTPYAELWMGTHGNAPSKVKENGQLLSSVLKEKPQYLGDLVLCKFGNELPFLLKILSINKALSIQAHPSKDIAKELHKSNPEIYKDANHKPEFTIALTKFEALCGFRPIDEIKWFMKNIRELRAIVGVDVAEKFICSNDTNEKEMLKECFRSLMLCPEDLVTHQHKEILYKFAALDEKTRSDQMAHLFERLSSQFPNDIGCFVIYFLNYIILQPNQALYLGPNEPHAYLSGDCVECMACSDNIIRAGLTPKYKDVEALCRILTYNSKPVHDQLLQPVREDEFCQIFKSPVPDFAVVRIEIPVNLKSYSLKSRESASILIVINGSGKMGSINLKAGVILFIPANEKNEVADIAQDMLMFQAMANVDLF